jgi:hypothetical protein
MQKKGMFWLTALFSAILALTTACGSTGPASATATSARPSAAPVSTSGYLYVLDGYTAGGTGQHIIAFRPGSAKPTEAITLPAGLFSQDHRNIYTATPLNGHTMITITNTSTDATVRSFAIPGTYSTAGQNYTTSVLSANGHWLALRQSGQGQGKTTIALIDTEAGKLFKTIRLKGEFDLDAVSPSGDRIYLLERLDRAGDYHVRYYDVSGNDLYEYPIIDKSDLDPNMIGSALTRQVSSDGTTAYTLYTEPTRNIAFVHILSLTGEFFDARCIDLPSGKSPALLRYYTLTLSADGSTLYAANGASGVVTAIHLDADVTNARIIKTVHFNAGNANVAGSDLAPALYNGAALAPDQKTLYVAGLHGIWQINTADLQVQRSYLAQKSFTGIAMTPGGQTLYAVSPTLGIIAIDVTSGKFQQITQSFAHTPWGVAWIE